MPSFEKMLKSRALLLVFSCMMTLSGFVSKAQAKEAAFEHVSPFALTASSCPPNATSCEEGFASLFNGKSLDNWELVGKTGRGYLAKNGKIILPPKGGGNLFTKEEYSDFILRFEFKLEEGSNNGLAIRAPLKGGSLAYEGMELQIIDNKAEKYNDIKPWQKHGSLYNVRPAKTGYLKSAGEWNRQTVVVDGRQIEVILNGHTILDVDLDEVQDPKTLEKHPGLQRTSGRIGFLGHNEPVSFRNICIKEL